MTNERLDHARRLFPHSSDPLAALERAEQFERDFESRTCFTCGGSGTLRSWPGLPSEQTITCGQCGGGGTLYVRRERSLDDRLVELHHEMDRQGYPTADDRDLQMEDTEWTALTVNADGSLDFRRRDGREGRASLPLLLIRKAWSKGLNLEGLADGFGAGRGTKGDWSAIRDSTEPAIAAMLMAAVNFLELH